MQRLTLSYVAGYLLVGGFGFLVAPDVTLRLLLSNGTYGDIMPRVVGMFMLALIVLTALYSRARDPSLLVFDAIVLIGLLPSIY